MTSAAVVVGGSAPAASSVATDRAVTELVEAALDSEDVLPLVRVVFDSKKPLVVDHAARLAGAPLASTGSGEAVAEDPGSRFGSRRSSYTGEHNQSHRSLASAAASEVGVLDDGDAAGVMDALLTVQDGQEMEIERLCRGHYVDIASCSEDIARMAFPISNMKETLFDNSQHAQQYGGQLLERLRESCELSTVKERLEGAKVVVERCTTALRLCDQAWTLIEEKKMYRALRLSQKILQLANGVTSDTARPTSDSLLALKRIGEVGQRESQMGGDLSILKPFIGNQAVEIASAVEQEVLTDFKEWMVEVRRKAGGVGQRAIRRAAQQRLREDEVIAETRALQAALLSSRDPREAATLCASIYSDGTEATGEEEGSMGGLLSDLDMTPLYRAHHIFQTLGKGAWFQSSYLNNRRQQMTTDLTISKAFVDVYQSYLNQLVGFFLVEDRVLRTSSGITTGSAVDGLWESALAQIKTALLGAYERLADPNALLLIKDFVHLVCRALAACSFHVTPVEEILNNGRSRYHELLLSNAVKQYTEVIEGDDLRSPLRVSTEQELQPVRETGLPLRLDSASPAKAVLASASTVPAPAQEPGKGKEWEAVEGEAVKLPLWLPFSAMVPEVIKVSKRFITDSAAYLRGIMGPGELLHIVRQFRDRLLSKVLCEAVMARIMGGGQPVAVVLQLVTNIWALKFSLPTLDDFTVEHSRQARWQMGNSSSSASAQNSTNSSRTGGSRSLASVSEATASLDALQSRAEMHAMGELTRQLDYILASAVTSVNWAPEGPPAQMGVCSDYMEKAIIYMQKHLGQARSILPPAPLRKLCIGMIRHCAKTMLDTWQGTGIQKFNIHAVRQLDTNVEAMEMYTSSLSTHPPHDFLAEFATFRDLLSLLLSNMVEELPAAATLSSRYPHLVSSSPIMIDVAGILEKYRDANSSLLHRSGKQDGPRRKDVLEVVKQLREMAATGVNQQSAGVGHNE